MGMDPLRDCDDLLSRVKAQRAYEQHEHDLKIEALKYAQMMQAEMMKNKYQTSPPKFAPEWRRQYEQARAEAAEARTVTYT
jgi:hypothetical protein